MRLSRPILSAFFNQRHQFNLSLVRNAEPRPCLCPGRLAATVLYATTSLSTIATLHPSIEDLTKKLDTLAPCFEFQEGEIEVLTTPEEFYNTIKGKILSAKRRIFLSTLYIGKEETELVQCSRS